jgi:von Willebrand factor type A domain
MNAGQPPAAPPGGRAPPPRVAPAPGRSQGAPAPGLPPPAGLRPAGAPLRTPAAPPGEQPLGIEPVAAPGSDPSITVEWRPVQLGMQHTLGCMIRVPAGSTLSVLVEQGIYRKALSGSDTLELAAIPVAAAGTEGRITLRDETRGLAAQYAWVWQTPGGRQRPQNFTLPAPAKPTAAPAQARAAAAKTNCATQQRTTAADAVSAGAATAFFGQAAQGRRIAFILDMSGSMVGARWRTCVEQLTAALQELSGDSEFFVVLFSNHLIEPPGQLDWMMAQRDLINGVIAWMQAIVPDGGTLPAPAFQRVYGLSTPPQAIYFLTDGQFNDCSAADISRLNTTGSMSSFGAFTRGVGRSLFGKGNAPDTPAVIHTIALDDASSAAVLQQIAQDSGGEYTHAASQ